jgi:hypothetical protein
VSFAAITLCVASQRVFIVVVDFVIDSVRKLLDTPSYCALQTAIFKSNILFSVIVCHLLVDCKIFFTF